MSDDPTKDLQPRIIEMNQTTIYTDPLIPGLKILFRIDGAEFSYQATMGGRNFHVFTERQKNGHLPLRSIVCRASSLGIPVSKFEELIAFCKAHHNLQQ